VRGATRAQRLAPLAACPEIVAARRTDDGGWEVVLVRYGRLAGTAAVDRRTDPHRAVAALRLTGEQVAAPIAPAPAAHPEEADLLLDWLDSPGVRLIDVARDGCDLPGRSCPVRGAQSYLDPARTAQMVTLLRGTPGGGAGTTAPGAA
jgi:DNA polymerase III subunit epsilon